MTLLREIQNDAVDQNVDISVLLRKCTILAARLGNEEFKLWVERELNGYSSKEDLPEYRILDAESHGNFLGVAWKANDVPIPPSMIPEEYQDIVTTVYFMHPISYYQASIMDRGNSRDILSQPWPADLIRLVGSKIYENMNCVNAWKVIPRSAIAALLDTVRNRVLRFVLEIEAEAPDIGEAPPDTKPISKERTAKIFQTVVMGNVANLAAGNGAIAQSTQITVVKNDLDSLKQYLASLGIREPDLKKLEQAIHQDAQSGAKRDLGNKVRTWMGKMISKAGTSTWNVAVSVAANLLTQALLKYYGLQ